MSEQALRDALQYDAIPTLLIFAEDNAGVRETIAKLRRVLATPPASAVNWQRVASAYRAVIERGLYYTSAELDDIVDAYTNEAATPPASAERDLYHG